MTRSETTLHGQANPPNGPRLIDEAEPGQKIADVLPEGLDLVSSTVLSHAGQRTPCCGLWFQRLSTFHRHVERYQETGVCLGSIPEGALLQVQTEDQILIIVRRGGGGGIDAS